MMQKTVVVTGGSSGIGLAIVGRFIDSGCRVFNLDIKPSNLGIFMQCDMTDHQAVTASMADIANDQAIDVLVCNAGRHLSANIEDTDEAALVAMFNLNVKGAYSATKAALPQMKQKGGSIIYIASEQALVAKSNSFAYNLSKHALASMAKTTAIDFAKYNIRSNAVCPGTIDTPLYHDAINRYCEKSGGDKPSVHAEEARLQPLGRIGKAAEVAALVHFLASDDATFITGSLQVIDGGYCAQ